MNARKAHNDGRNHIQNVRDYFAELTSNRAQNTIDAIVNNHQGGGRSQMFAAPSMRIGAGFMNPMATAPGGESKILISTLEVVDQLELPRTQADRQGTRPSKEVLRRDTPLARLSRLTMPVDLRRRVGPRVDRDRLRVLEVTEDTVVTEDVEDTMTAAEVAVAATTAMDATDGIAMDPADAGATAMVAAEVTPTAAEEATLTEVVEETRTAVVEATRMAAVVVVAAVTATAAALPLPSLRRVEVCRPSRPVAAVVAILLRAGCTRTAGA